VDLVRLKQRALVGLELYYGDNRDDTHMFQMIKAHDVAQHTRRKQVSEYPDNLPLSSLSMSLCVSLPLSVSVDVPACLAGVKAGCVHLCR